VYATHVDDGVEMGEDVAHGSPRGHASRENGVQQAGTTESREDLPVRAPAVDTGFPTDLCSLVHARLYGDVQGMEHLATGIAVSLEPVEVVDRGVSVQIVEGLSE